MFCYNTYVFGNKNVLSMDKIVISERIKFNKIFSFVLVIFFIFLCILIQVICGFSYWFTFYGILLSIVFGVLVHQQKHDKSTRITKITLENNILTLIGYKNENEFCENIKLEDIKSCKFSFYGDVDKKSLMPSLSDLYCKTLLMIHITFNDGHILIESFDCEYNDLKLIFDIAKCLPNFSYNISTNSYVLSTNIKQIIETGKTLPFINALQIVFMDSEITPIRKIITILLFFLSIYVCVFVVPKIILFLKMIFS